MLTGAAVVITISSYMQRLIKAAELSDWFLHNHRDTKVEELRGV